jgi:hypothetical protein
VPIDSNIIKDALVEEIGDDPPALQAYTLFNENNYPELLDHWLLNSSAMRPDNAQRFKEMLIWGTSVIATKTDFDRWDTWANPWKEKILRVVGNRENVTKDIFQHSRFCYEMMFSILVDIGEEGDNFCEYHFCGCITFHCRANPFECLDTGDVVGCVEWLVEYCYPWAIWPGLGDD